MPDAQASPKIVVVTGASSGIGYYCAQQLQKRGYRVIATCRQPKDVERLQQEGIDCIELDYASSDSVQQAWQDILALSEGRIDVLFNNGAYGQPGAVEDITRDTLRQQFEANLFGWHELTRCALGVMLEQGSGRIVHNSSVLGLVAMPFRGAYNASKFALEGLTDTLRMELSDTNIHLSLIEPGPILSRFRHNALQQLRANVDISNSRHQQGYQNAIERLAAPGPASRFTLGPDAVLERLLHAIEHPKPKARYYVTFPTYLMAYCRRLLSTRWLDRLLIAAGKD